MTGSSSSPSSPTLSVIVVSFNTREDTLACLRTALAQDVAGGLEVLLVDNGSSDGTVAAVAAELAQVRIVDAGENLGFAAACNLGAEAATGTYLLLLNPDTLVHDGAFTALVDFARANPRHGIYGGRTLRPDGTLDPSSAWGAPTLWSLLCFATMLSTLARRNPVLDPESLGGWQRDTVREVDIVTGCLLLTSARTWQRLGGMDEDYFLYGEDAELSARARRAGLRPVIVPGAVITHEVGGSTSSSGRKMTMVMAGKVTLLRKTWRPGRAAVGRWLLLAGTSTRTLAERVTRRPGMWSEVWARRADWREGYPRARATIFGLPLERTAR